MSKARQNSSLGRFLLGGTALGIAAAFLLMVSATRLAGQVFELSGGSSSLFAAHGGSVVIHGQNYTARFGIGQFGKLGAGFFLGAPYRGINWGLGDQVISFVLPTDLFNRSYYFFGRGLGATWRDGQNTLFLYGGVTSIGFATPFLNVARAETGAGALFYERRLSSSLRFLSQNVFSRRQTSIESFEWKARENLKLALSAGLGDNQHYWASSLDFARPWISLKASYAVAGDSFRRIRVEAPLVTETERENIQLELAPWRNLRVSLSRNNYLAPADSRADHLRATVNGYGLWTSAGGFQLYGALFDSETKTGRSRAISLGARRRLFDRVEAGVQYLRSKPPGGRRFETLVSTFRQTLTRRLSLTQVVTHSDGHTSLVFGGDFLSNRLTLGLEYQTVFVPFTQGARSQFRQAMLVNVRVQLPGNLQLHGTTNVTPTGRVRYTGHATGFLYRTESAPGAAPRETMYENVVRGRVVEEMGQAVRGAALRLDSTLVFTDSQGAFLLRVKKRKTYRLEVLLDQFMFPGRYEVVSAPTEVVAAPEEIAPVHAVVLHRLPVLLPGKR